MRSPRLLAFALVAALVAFPGAVSGQNSGQQQPSPSQAQQVRERLAASGLSPEQIRDRLRAAGYNPGLLDAYMPGAERGAGAPDPTPGDSVVRALEFLNRVDDRAQAQAGNPANASQPRAETPAAGDRGSELEIFGLAVFRRSTSQFDPLLAGPVDGNYRLGPRDVLSVFMTGTIEQSHTLEVTREGFVVVPGVGQVNVANMTLDQATSTLLQRVRRVYASVGTGPGASTQFYVTVARLRTNQIFVVGEVTNPGSYQISSAGTGMSALYAAGGPTNNGSLRRLEVRRAGRTIGTVDLYDYLLTGTAGGDTRLENGDVVFVPLHGPRVKISGPVNRPAIYELKRGETLADLLRLAGGLAPRASLDRAVIRRILPPEQRGANGFDRVVVAVSGAELRNGASVALQPDDEVELFGVSDRLRRSISVTGNVWNGGDQGLVPGLTVSGALRAAGGVRPDFASDVLVTRTLPDGRTTQIHTTLVDTTGRVTNDFALEEDDAVRVFSASEMRTTIGVDVVGRVREPGTFAFREGMTLRDVILLAKGFPDSASVLSDVVLWRLRPDRSRMELRVPVWDSTRTAYNPFRLEPGDSIRVFNRTEFRPDRFIRISGAVNEERQVPYAEGMTLRDAIQLARGLSEGAYLNRVEIARLPEERRNGTMADTLHVSIDSTYLFERAPGTPYLGAPGIDGPSSGAPDVLLKPYDHILVLRQPEWQLPQVVVLSGQVTYPGTYALKSRDERLADVIDRAGGLTPIAYADGVIFVRGRENIGRVAIDLERALRDRRSRENVALLGGDTIHVPRYIPVVRVEGAVNSPVSVPYVRGKGFTYYVNAAGGLANNANLDRSFVRQPNGAVEAYNARRFLPDAAPEPRAGATVVVGAADPNNKKDWAQIAGSVAQVLGTLVAIVAIVQRNR